MGEPQVHPDRVKWSASYLRAGTTSVSYRAVAVTPGIFVHPPAKCSVLGQPEVGGLSGAQAFVVTENSLSPAEAQSFLAANDIAAAATSAPKACAEPCDELKERCNLRTGQCEAEDQAPAFMSSALRGYAAPIVRPSSVSLPHAPSSRPQLPAKLCKRVPREFQPSSCPQKAQLGFAIRGNKCIKLMGCPKDRKRVREAGGQLFRFRKPCLKHLRAEACRGL
jgi:hypothetical protein